MARAADAGGDLARGSPAPPPASYAASGVLWRIAKLAFHYPWRVALATLFSLVTATLSLLVPQFIGQAVDQAHTLLAAGALRADEARAALWWTASLIFGVTFLRGVFQMMQGYQGEVVGQRVAYELRLAFFEKLQRLPFSYHDRVHSGDLITRGMLDVEGSRMFIEGAMLRVTLLVMLIGVGAYNLLTRDFWLGLCALSFVPFVAWRATAAHVRLRESWQALQALMSDLTRVIEENLQGIRVVRAFSARAYELLKFD